VFDLAKEKFQLIVPATYKHAEKWGVFIWISPGDTAAIPADWEPVLAARKLLFVGALKSGNPRNIFDRVRLAVAANTAMRERFNVDGRRVYVSGHSGGGRVASMVGVAYADMFSGTMPFMGVNFYEDIPAGDGKTTYGANFIPDEEVLVIAKKFCRYALVTGEKDFNRAGTKTLFEQGFKKEGFANVTYLEVPGQGHGLPSAKWLEQGLDFLDTGKGVRPAEVK
jgi:dienelactone hydrolase